MNPFIRHSFDIMARNHHTFVEYLSIYIYYYNTSNIVFSCCMYASCFILFIHLNRKQNAIWLLLFKWLCSDKPQWIAWLFEIFAIIMNAVESFCFLVLLYLRIIYFFCLRLLSSCIFCAKSCWHPSVYSYNIHQYKHVCIVNISYY